MKTSITTITSKFKQLLLFIIFIFVSGVASGQDMISTKGEGKQSTINIDTSGTGYLLSSYLTPTDPDAKSLLQQLQLKGNAQLSAAVAKYLAKVNSLSMKCGNSSFIDSFGKFDGLTENELREKLLTVLTETALKELQALAKQIAQLGGPAVCELLHQLANKQIIDELLSAKDIKISGDIMDKYEREGNPLLDKLFSRKRDIENLIEAHAFGEKMLGRPMDPKIAEEHAQAIKKLEVELRTIEQLIEMLRKPFAAPYDALFEKLKRVVPALLLGTPDCSKSTSLSPALSDSTLQYVSAGISDSLLFVSTSASEDSLLFVSASAPEDSLFFTSATEEDNLDLVVFPQPAEQGALIQLSWPAQEEAFHLVILDPYGTTIETKDFPIGESSFAVDTHHWLSGFYHLLMYSETETVTRKIVIE